MMMVGAGTPPEPQCCMAFAPLLGVKILVVLMFLDILGLAGFSIGVALNDNYFVCS